MSKRWVATFFEEKGQIGQSSAKRLVFIIAGLCMSISILVLAVSSLLGHSVSVELGAVAMPLAGMAGYGYVQGQKAAQP